MGTHILSADKDFLRRIVDHDFTIPNNVISAYELAFALMPNLRSPDPELRDELSYSILARIIQVGMLSAKELEELLFLSMSEGFLVAGIGERDTDTVFTRCFAILIVAAIVEADAEARLLSPEQIHHTTSIALDYARRERDHRGFIDGKGWAHSVAHTADALDSCAHHPVTTTEERIAILEVIAELATLPEPLTYMEDDRLAFPVLRMVQGEQVELDYLHSWVCRFDIDIAPPKETTLRHVNAENFLRSLYFLLHWEQPNHPLLGTLADQLKHLNVFYRYGVLGSNVVR